MKRITRIILIISGLTKGFPLETTFQTVNQVQNFTCATELLGDNTNAKVRTEAAEPTFSFNMVAFGHGGRYTI